MRRLAFTDQGPASNVASWTPEEKESKWSDDRFNYKDTVTSEKSDRSDQTWTWPSKSFGKDAGTNSSRQPPPVLDLTRDEDVEENDEVIMDMEYQYTYSGLDGYSILFWRSWYVVQNSFHLDKYPFCSQMPIRPPVIPNALSRIYSRIEAGLTKKILSIGFTNYYSNLASSNGITVIT